MVFGYDFICNQIPFKCIGKRREFLFDFLRCFWLFSSCQQPAFKERFRKFNLCFIQQFMIKSMLQIIAGLRFPLIRISCFTDSRNASSVMISLFGYTFLKNVSSIAAFSKRPTFVMTILKYFSAS